MSVINSAGSQIHYATAFGTTVTATAFTNASSAVITAVGHGITVGDFVQIITSPWQRLEGRVFRASVVATNDVTLEGCDTTNTTLFPAAGGIGTTYRRITTWTAMTQIARDIEIGGGDLKKADITFLSDVIEKQQPTFRAPPTLGLPFFFDPSLSWLSGIRTLSDTQASGIFRLTAPSGAKILVNGFVSLNEIPQNRDGVFQARVDVDGIALPTTYAT